MLANVDFGFTVSTCAAPDGIEAIVGEQNGYNRGIFGIPCEKKSEIEDMVKVLESLNPNPRPTLDLDKARSFNFNPTIVFLLFFLKYQMCAKLVVGWMLEANIQYNNNPGIKKNEIEIRDFISLGDFLQIFPWDIPSLQSASYYNMATQMPNGTYLPSHTAHASLNVVGQSCHMQFPRLYHSQQPGTIANPHHMVVICFMEIANDVYHELEKRQAIVDGLRDSVLGYSVNVPGTIAKDVMDMVLVTWYFDTMKEIGAASKSSIVFILHVMAF
ncbi:unnamed protein product [Lactuca saligna]|uniref:Uncharacterized protein n=1 Tax=Lactuca saligna TaxID=75948 RepID=A0AA35Z4G8_LACSI|nr:unnamed protein product [Lactuca saligna]